MVSGCYDPAGPIFISYRQSDGRELAGLVDTYLRSAGLVPWRDLVDLPPGETAQRIHDAMAEGLSAAILLVTNDIDKSEFIKQHELPQLLEMDGEGATGFSLSILNAISDSRNPAEVDYKKPDSLLGCVCDPPLSERKQYALLEHNSQLRQLVDDLLKLRIRGWKKYSNGDELRIQTQTRPLPDARSPKSGVTDVGSDHDLMIRLRQDVNIGIPEELGYRCLQQTLPLVVDALYAHGVKKVTLSGGGHPSVAWALGAALPETRIGDDSLRVIDLKGHVWATTATTQKPEQKQRLILMSEPSKDVISREHEERQQRPRAAVLLRSGSNTNERAFQQMADQLPGCTQILRLQVTDSSIPSTEGFRLAKEIAKQLRQWGEHYELHIATSLPVALVTLIARYCNTINPILYEWGDDPGRPGVKKYYPVARMQSGAANGPITEVFAQRRLTCCSSTETVTDVVNLTPHPFRLYRDGVIIRQWPAAAENQWVRVKDDVENKAPLSFADVTIPVSELTAGPLENEPPPRDGVAYIVSRLAAEASARSDYYFPFGEVRDEHGSIIGATGLAQWAPHEASLQNLLRLLSASSRGRT